MLACAKLYRIAPFEPIMVRIPMNGKTAQDKSGTRRGREEVPGGVIVASTQLAVKKVPFDNVTGWRLTVAVVAGSRHCRPLRHGPSRRRYPLPCRAAPQRPGGGARRRGWCIIRGDMRLKCAAGGLGLPAATAADLGKTGRSQA